ncbi:MAG: hypothetical protein JKY67_02040 [Pseudomonadales bacterium]|nr:hypothetical protein [Pseudomonadales bacterium]
MAVQTDIGACDRIFIDHVHWRQRIKGGPSVETSCGVAIQDRAILGVDGGPVCSPP